MHKYQYTLTKREKYIMCKMGLHLLLALLAAIFIVGCTNDKDLQIQNLTSTLEQERELHNNVLTDLVTVLKYKPECYDALNETTQVGITVEYRETYPCITEKGCERGHIMQVTGDECKCVNIVWRRQQ